MMNSDQFFDAGIPGVLTNQGTASDGSVSGPVVPRGKETAYPNIHSNLDNPVPSNPTEASIPDSANPSAQSLAAILELVSRVNGCGTIREAGNAAAKGLAEWLQAANVEVYFQRKPGSNSQSIGGHGNDEADKEDNETLCRSAAEEILARATITDSHAKAKRDQVGTLAVQRYARATSATRVLGAALGPPCPIDGDDVCRGAIIARYTDPLGEADAEETLRKLDASREPLFQCLTRIAETEPPAWWIGIRKRCGPRATRKRNLLLFVATVICGVMFVPTPYHAPVRSRLQPVGRRFISAPIDGRLEQVFVRPGDRVESGTVLARLDAREIEMEISGKRAELSRMQQEKKAQLADHQYARSRLANLRAERLQSEIDLLEIRRNRLKVVAPIAGIVVSGDWKRSEGTVLERGDTLFEIAPEGRFVVEVAVDESDVLLITTGMPLRFRLDAIPHQRFESTIDRIHPRPELRENESVFIAEARLDDSEGLLRPGMRGNGHVETGRHPIGWNWLHRPYHQILFWIGV